MVRRAVIGSDVLITGAASGLGKHLAFDAHARGYRVHLIDVSPAVADVAGKTGGRHLVVDLAERAGLDRVAAWAPDIDVLINNAGIASKAPFHEMDAAKIEVVVRVNVLAPLLLARFYLERFVRRGSGVIVNVSSSAAYFPTPGLAPYGASKAFLSSLTETLIAETRDTPGVTVLGVCPSGMRTEFQRTAGVRNERPDLLLEPARVAAWILDAVARRRSGLVDYGVTTRAFKLLRGLLPSRIYLAVIGRLFERHR